MKSVIYPIFSAVVLSVLMLFQATVQAQDPAPQEPSGDDVLAVLNASEDHTIFSDLIEEAQLTETLQQQGPFTILAPTDDAFEPMEEELDELRQSPQQLQSILINHLFQGEANSEEVEQQFNVEIENGDQEASNGVIHSINEVFTSQGGGPPSP